MAQEKGLKKEHIGHDDGEVLASGEVVVYDKDKDGNVIGWHKVPAESK